MLMHVEDDNILKYYQDKNSSFFKFFEKASFVVYVETESLREKY